MFFIEIILASWFFEFLLNLTASLSVFTEALVGSLLEIMFKPRENLGSAAVFTVAAFESVHVPSLAV